MAVEKQNSQEGGLDIEQPEALKTYLRQTNRIALEEEPEVHALAGGVSNRTVLVQRPTGEAWVMKQALAKLRVPTDWFSSPQRIHREALGLRWLPQFAPDGSLTPLIFEDEEQHVLAMQAVPQPHQNWKTLLLAGLLEQNHIDQFGHILGSIHRRSWERRQEISSIFADTTFFETLRIEPYYRFTATRVPEVGAFLDDLIEKTRTQRLTLVHGDYSPKNVLVHQQKLILLDHEVIHYGDPAFDLGFSLAHLLSKAHHLPALRQSFAQAASRYWQMYHHTLGDVPWLTADMESRAVNHTLACLLARVDGLSPLEYLTEQERTRQHHVVLTLIGQFPETMPMLIEHFVERISEYDKDPTSRGLGDPR